MESGEYTDTQQFIEVAIENQLRLQDSPLGFTPTGPIDEGAPHTVSSTQQSHEFQSDLLVLPDDRVLYLQGGLERSDKTIWGLYNRIFPSKIALRVISNMTIKQSIPLLNLDEVQNEAGKAARMLGHELDYRDKKAKKQHGEKLATGLPMGSRDKATLRYQKMFVGSPNGNGSGKGLPAELGFVTIKKENGRGLIGLTERGATFARLQNPILDNQQVQSASTLSEEELEFVIRHLKERMPKEWERCRVMLRSIREGEETPRELDNALRHLDKSLDSGTSTERAGIVSRLTEIGLVTRRREGLAVFYSLTDRGKRVSQ